MGWKRLDGGENAGRDLVKWDRVGMELEGIWKGTVEGEYGELGQILQDDGTLVAFPYLTVLERRLKDVEEGERIHITYTGKKISQKSGREYKDFDVDVFIKDADS